MFCGRSIHQLSREDPKKRFRLSAGVWIEPPLDVSSHYSAALANSTAFTLDKLRRPNRFVLTRSFGMTDSLR